MNGIVQRYHSWFTNKNHSGVVGLATVLSPKRKSSESQVRQLKSSPHRQETRDKQQSREHPMQRSQSHHQTGGCSQVTRQKGTVRSPNRWSQSHHQTKKQHTPGLLWQSHPQQVTSRESSVKESVSGIHESWKLEPVRVTVPFRPFLRS